MMFSKVLGRIFPERLFQYTINKAKKATTWDKGIVSLSFDCEYRRDIESLPQLLRLLKKYKIQASFACIGRWIEEYPKEHKQILAGKHEILNHTYSHPDHEELNPRRFDSLTLNEKKEEIIKCHKTCQDILDYNMKGFRAPHLARVSMSNIYKILAESDYIYSSSKLSVNTKYGGMPYVDGGIIELPISTCPSHPWIAFDSYHSFVIGKHKSDFPKMSWRVLQTGINNNLYVNVYFDPTVVHESDFELFLKQMSESRNKIKILNLGELANLIQKKQKRKVKYSNT